MGFKLGSHTADLQIIIDGHDINELFVSALHGFIYLLVGVAQHDYDFSILISLDAEDYESLIVCFLNKLIFLFEIMNFIPIDADVVIDKFHLDATIYGHKKKVEIKHCIKAATYHDLSVDYSTGLLMASIILDD